MSEFIVFMKEVWIQAVKIRAQTKEQAIDLVADGQGDFVESDNGFEFSYTLSKDEWNVEESSDSIELISSGYEWTCPDCDTLNEEIEITAAVTCSKCKKKFMVAEHFHAYE